MSDINQILLTASRGSKLFDSLYDFAATIPSATTDAAQLANGVKDLSRALWQIGVSQREDERVASNDARESVADIVQQSQLVFTEIEAVVPLEKIRDGTALTYGEKWEWSQVARTKVQYLLGHVEALRLTLEVLSQTLKSVKVLEWSWSQPRSTLSTEAVTIDRLQLQGLVMEQQLAFLKACELFDVYQKATDDSDPRYITQDQGSLALTLFEDHAPNPRRLMRYQENELAAKRSAQTETQRLALVRRVSSPYIDFLLNRWTRLRDIRKQQQPSIDSDDSSDDDRTPQPTHSNGSRGPPGPILTHIDEVDDEHQDRSPSRSPMPIPDPAVRSRAQISPGVSPSTSWKQDSPAYYGAAPPVRPPGSGAYSTPVSPRVSFSSGPNARPQLSPMSSPNSAQRPVQTARIAWRLRVNQKVWDHENENIVKQNCPEHPSQIDMQRNPASTEILATYVSEDAIRDKGYLFDRFMTDISNGRNPQFEPVYIIRRPLTFTQVKELVKRTEERYEQRFKKARPRPHLEHSATAPLPTPGRYLQTPPDHRRSTSKGLDDRRRGSNVSSMTNSGSDYERDYRSGSRQRRSSSSMPSSKSSNDQKGSSTGKNIQKFAAGAGIAALLDGLSGL